MKRFRQLLGRTVFSASVLAALAFGVWQVAAPPPAQAAVYCDNQPMCQGYCDIHWPNTVGRCSFNHVCTCEPVP